MTSGSPLESLEASRPSRGRPTGEEVKVPRYVVQRSFRGGLALPANADGARACLDVVAGNTEFGVTWIHSYVSDDLETTFCVYDSPDPEAIRRAAERNGRPVDHITEVSVLDPYFYTGPAGRRAASEASRGGAS